LILSDLHAFERLGASDAQPSYLRVSAPDISPGAHPVRGLLDLIAREGIRADVLVSPGDLGDRAEPAAIKYAWEKLHAIGSQVGASLVVAASGNHDLDTRFHSSPFDTKAHLQSLTPPYPLPDRALNNQYWADHYAVWRRDGYRLVVLNSCAFHAQAPQEIDHGRVSPYTLQRLAADLESDPDCQFNILLCHHHPQQQMELQLGELDFMRNGQGLLDLLGSGRFGSWLVVHGHKHLPKLCYAAGGSSSATVLSAGSFSICLYGELQTRARNQLHLVELVPTSNHCYSLAGRVRSWQWAAGDGWARATGNSGLPFECGFGCRTSARAVAGAIAKVAGGKKVAWKAVRAAVPDLEYLVPLDVTNLKLILRTEFSLVALEEDSVIVELVPAS
jgi:hypothetical protein